jgi:hypothetical protein
MNSTAREKTEVNSYFSYQLSFSICDNIVSQFEDIYHNPIYIYIYMDEYTYIIYIILCMDPLSFNVCHLMIDHLVIMMSIPWLSLC